MQSGTFAIDTNDTDFTVDPGAVRDPFTGQRLVLLDRAPVTVLVAKESYFLDMDYADGIYSVVVPSFMAMETASFTCVVDALEYFDGIHEFLARWVDFQTVPREEGAISNAWHSFPERTTETEILDWFADRYSLSREITLATLPVFELVAPGSFYDW